MRIATIGETPKVAGLALAGTLVFAADVPDELDAAWDELPEDVGILVLTPAAEARLGGRFDERPLLLTVVSPE